MPIRLVGVRACKARLASGRMADKSKAQSETFRARGPQQSSVQVAVKIPARSINPFVGFRPTSPLKAAGMRTEPPESPPREPRARLAATATSEPTLDPPGINSSFQGLRQRPK